MRLCILTGALVCRMAFFILFWRFLITSQPQLCFSFSLYSRLSPSFAGGIQLSGFAMNIPLSFIFFKLISFPENNIFRSKSRPIQISAAHKEKNAPSSFRFDVFDQMRHPLVKNFTTASAGILNERYITGSVIFCQTPVIPLKIAAIFRTGNPRFKSSEYLRSSGLLMREYRPENFEDGIRIVFIINNTLLIIIEQNLVTFIVRHLSVS